MIRAVEGSEAERATVARKRLIVKGEQGIDQKFNDSNQDEEMDGAQV